MTIITKYYENIRIPILSGHTFLEVLKKQWNIVPLPYSCFLLFRITNVLSAVML